MKNAEKLNDRITQAFASSMGEPEVAREIAFHMTDWVGPIEDVFEVGVCNEQQ